MMATRELAILHFEDSRTTREMVKRMFSKEDIRVRSENTLYNCERYLQTHLANDYQAIICDVMLPHRCAFDVFDVLADSGKPCIFYTSLDEDTFWRKVKKVLKKIPSNFKFIGKAKKDSFNDLRKQILTCV